MLYWIREKSHVDSATQERTEVNGIIMVCMYVSLSNYKNLGKLCLN